MAQLFNDERYVDFDAIQGYKALRDKVEDKQMPVEWTKLVVEVGDHDPDAALSIVAYEKGFALLRALEKQVGSEDFMFFFQDYLEHFANDVLVSDNFRDFFMAYFADKDNLHNFEWEKWFHEPGMPLEDPEFNRDWSEQAEALANQWFQTDRQGEPEPDVDLESWSSNQKVCFLDNLQDLSRDKPLKKTTVDSLHKDYGFGGSHNAEVLYRFCQLALAAEDENILLVVIRFVTSQGRIKFTRPLYKAMFASRKFRQVAKSAFLEHKTFYHPTCAKLIQHDLQQIEQNESGISFLFDEAKMLWEKTSAHASTLIAQTEVHYESAFTSATEWISSKANNPMLTFAMHEAKESLAKARSTSSALVTRTGSVYDMVYASASNWMETTKSSILPVLMEEAKSKYEKASASAAALVTEEEASMETSLAAAALIAVAVGLTVSSHREIY